MKIKVIDLLKMIAEDKKLPEKFMYKGHLYYRQETMEICYSCDEINEIFEECLVLEDLNDYIEILEEPKNIEKIDFGTLNTQKEKNRAMKDTINKLIDEINKLKEND